MATSTRTDTRERILRATLELIGSEGIAAVTNRRVAEAADVALGSLTYHFPSQVDLLRDSLLLYVGEEVARLEAVAAELRGREADYGVITAAVRSVAEESAGTTGQAAELELHLRASRDPGLQEASRRCFEAYEGVAAAALEALGVPEAKRHARTIVAGTTGAALRQLGTGQPDPDALVDALKTIVRGATSDA